MPAQYDYITGLDFSGIASPSAQQINQAINQVAPLPNIGGILWKNGVPSVQDMADNPRWVRYLLVDTSTATATAPPTLKVWNAIVPEWQTAALADGSISTTGKLADNIVTIAKLNSTGAAALDLLQVQADGSGFQYVTLASLLDDVGVVPTAAINTAGASNRNYFKYNGSNAVWSALDLSLDVANGAIPIAKLANGAAYEILRMSDVGEIEWIANTNTNLLGDDSVLLSHLAPPAGIAAGDTIKWDGADWVKTSPGLTSKVELMDSAVWQTGNVPRSFSMAGLTSTPKLFRAVLVCTTGFDIFQAGDEFNVESFSDSGSGNALFSVSYDASANAVIVGFDNGAGEVASPTAGSYNNIATAERLNWTIKVYAWA